MAQSEGDNCDVGDIRSLYKGAKVLVTGATGFIGKVLTESLLRKTEVERIYLLVRGKNGVPPGGRLRALLTEEIFRSLEEKRPGRLSDVVEVCGDLSDPALGLSPEDADLLASEVEIVFHLAANVRFYENLKVTVEQNCRGTKLLLDLARRMRKLKVIIHCSTAFAPEFLDEIEEKIYPAEEIDLIKLVDAVNIKTAQKITKVIRGKSANTYVYSKFMTEHLINKDYRDLPIGIVRPGIVVSSVKDPLPGYIDNKYGPTGIAVEVMNGLVHCYGADPSASVELVPGDFTANAHIAAAWDTFRRFKTKTETPVYNVVPGGVAPVRWSEVVPAWVRVARKEAPATSSWYPFCFLPTSWYQVLFISFIFHSIPAAIVDFVLRLSGKKPKLMKTTMKFEKVMKVLFPFTTRKWIFHNSNLRSLWKNMTKEEQELFPFNFEGFNWPSYLEIYMNGIKKFIMKDSISKEDAQKRAQRHFIHHWGLITFILIIFSSVLYSVLY